MLFVCYKIELYIIERASKPQNNDTVKNIFTSTGNQRCT